MSLITNADQDDAGAVASSTTPVANGTATAGILATFARADHVHPDDVVERQALGADAQDLTFAVSAADERVIIEGYGPNSQAGASTTVTGKFNSTALWHAAILTDGGAAPTASSTALWGASNASDIGFFIIADVRAGFANRGLMGMCWTGAGATDRRLYFFMAKFADAATAITQIVLAGSNATAFKLGFKTVVRRRKMSA